MTTRRWTSPALLGLLVLSLSACTTAGVFGGPYPGQGRAPRTSGPVYDRPANHPRSSAEYRRVRQDAARYANQLDRELRLNNRQERAIRDLLIDRAESILRRTNPRHHRAVYPFPRDGRLPRDAQRWWTATDRQIERVLTGHQRREYRSIAQDLDRYGRYDRNRHRGDDRYDRDGDRYDRDDRHDNGRGRGHDGRGRGRGRGH